MSDEGERTCPLCAEEMDMTDQQLKPCKCGYEICVWCWHHIMDMAEKDDSEGRCPACRSAYDKEKIVGMAANCERLVAEVSSERKKSQKAKSKSSDGRKQLTSVRVIQRNLVYIVGLPLNLADEELLQRKEYFAQYGKVLKVSMSRTAAGVIQQFPNNTCSVYITYSKEEEAIRCIQSVHGFVVEGKSLKACFGTTKYCHAWLRNVPCTNPDCLYLHEIGCQEDSFTKDEIISAYTRSRIQQITGGTNNLQRRAGNVLPPPADDYCNNTSVSPAKPIVKNTTNQNTPNVIKGSPPNGTCGRSAALPAAASWATRASTPTPVGSLPSSNGPCKQKSETINNALPFSTAVASTTHVPALHGNEGKNSSLNDECPDTTGKGKPDALKPLKQPASVDSQSAALEKSASTDEIPSTVTLGSAVSCPPSSNHKDGETSIPSHNASTMDDSGLPSEREKDATGEEVQELCSDMLLMSIEGNVRNEHSGGPKPDNLSDQGSIRLPGNQALQQYNTEQFREIPASGIAETSMNGFYISSELSDLRRDSQSQAVIRTSSDIEDDILSFDNQRLKDPELSRSSYLPTSANPLHLSSLSRSHSLQCSEAFGAVNTSSDPLFVDSKSTESSFLHPSGLSIVSNGYPENVLRNAVGSYQAVENSFLHPNEGRPKQRGQPHGNTDSNATVDTGENSIISNILSMDLDVWDESLTSPQNFAKILGEIENQSNSQKISSSWKAPSNSQSRFSFARREDSRIHDVEPSFSIFGQLSKGHSLNPDLAEHRDISMERFGINNTLTSSNFEASENFSSNQAVFPSKRLSVSRSQISAPPGFSIPNKVPPPGFSSHERVDQAFDNSGNHLLDSYSMFRNSYQPPANVSSPGDIEFMDPAILAVGKGRLPSGINNSGLDARSNFPSQLSAFENETRLQMLMQRSASLHQNLRISDFGDSFSSHSDSYGISSRLIEQSQVNNLSPFAQLTRQQSRNPLMSNGHWDGWNEVQGGKNIGVADLRNERLEYSKFYSGYEDTKYRMPSSGDLYNRTYGM